jgi:hypothetical protein
LREAQASVGTLKAVGTAAGVLGVVFLLFMGGYFMTNGEEVRTSVMQSFHFAFVFWVSLTLGFFGLTLLHHTIRAQWALPLLRIFEAGGGPGSIFLMLIMFLPIAAGMGYIFEWMDPKKIDDVLRSKAWILNQPAFLIGSFVCFGAWLLWSTILRSSSVREDETRDPAESQKRTNLAAPGIVMFMVTCTLASTLWIMSLEPHWYSTVFGALYAIGTALTGLALAVLIFNAHSTKDPYANVVNKQLGRDHGNMLLALTMLWAYLTLSQFLIIWAANLPEEIPYYIVRSDNGWNFLGLLIILGQFFAPFLALIAPKTKHTPRLLMMVAIWILIIRILDYFWLVVPSLHGRGAVINLSAWDVVAWVGIGGVWLMVFAIQFGKAAVFPKHDPRIREALGHARS